MWKASSIYKTIMTTSGRSIGIGFVTETDAWRRIHLAEHVKTSFAAAVERIKDTLREDTVEVVLKEAEHESPLDQRTHFSALEMNGSKEVTAARHILK